ncbi:PREDICTED: uncharacterized protein LOC104573635 [Tinamus guttatus]|uniref:uncharacterized protein LOC104573635 n=1 Tax=Tinamus guttatus TaxID=94827 RepID=UPI00052EEF51|nr:PREDICTED: uncharacterized protein LOC104573635 [Tinamus guttatus]
MEGKRFVELGKEEDFPHELDPLDGELDPGLPSTEDVILKTEQVTKNIQELLRAAQESKHDSFVPCSEKIHSAVTEMASLFPKKPALETVRSSLRRRKTPTGSGSPTAGAPARSCASRRSKTAPTGGMLLKRLRCSARGLGCLAEREEEEEEEGRQKGPWAALVPCAHVAAGDRLRFESKAFGRGKRTVPTELVEKHSSKTLRSGSRGRSRTPRGNTATPGARPLQ